MMVVMYFFGTIAYMHTDIYKNNGHAELSTHIMNDGMHF